jgi:pimeloyl-ACP methyl ester carboxylesterase
MRTVATSAGPVAVTVSGRGPAVVLLHANPGDSGDFDAIVPALAQRFTTYAVDWPGYGASAPMDPPTATTAMGYADLLPEVVAGLGPDRVALIGNSVGGFAAARLAVTHPPLVSALVLVNSGGFTGVGPLTRAAIRIKGTETVTALLAGRLPKLYLRRRTPAVRTILAREWGRRHDRTAIAVEAAIWRSFARPEHDLRRDAGRIVAPTLLVWGTRDPILGRAGRDARRAMPAARWHAMPTGHAPYAEAPDEFLAVVTPFLVRHG